MTGAVQRLKKLEAEWMAKSTQAAIDAAKAVIADKSINGRASIGSLNDLEWGWIALASVFAWIKSRSEQAVAEGQGYEQMIRSMPGHFPQPWEAGAVESVLPAMGEIEDLPWDKPIGEWPKARIVSFSWHVYLLIEQALSLRDEGAADKITQAVAERDLSARNGGPLLSRKELDDDVPF